jgi:hypothetical protein
MIPPTTELGGSKSRGARLCARLKAPSPVRWGRGLGVGMICGTLIGLLGQTIFLQTLSGRTAVRPYSHNQTTLFLSYCSEKLGVPGVLAVQNPDLSASFAPSRLSFSHLGVSISHSHSASLPLCGNSFSVNSVSALKVFSWRPWRLGG